MNEEDRLSEAGANTSRHGGSKAKPKKAKEPLKETTETAQNTALVDEVISMFKGYLSSKLEEKGKQCQAKASIEKQTTEFKFKGNRKQFEFNAQVDELMSPIADNADDPQKVRALTATAKDTIKKRQKLIKLADKNKDGWLVVEEYESDDLSGFGY
jgi:urocanate hydratase